MNIDALVEAQINHKLIRASFFLRLDSDTPVRAWAGIGDFVLPVDTIEVDGGTYKGVGILNDIPSFQQLVNGIAQRVEFSMSGVDDQIAALADEEASEIRSKRVNVGLQFLDEEWQPLAPIIWVWEGEADVIRKSSVSSPDFQRINTITLSVGSLTTGRRRPSLSYFTGAQQRRRSADDAFCDRTGLYSQGSEIKWPF